MICALISVLDLLLRVALDQTTMAFGLSPEWLEYQLQHLNEDRAPEILGVGISFFTVATVAVCLRLLARKISKVRCGHDDYFIVIALVCALKQRNQISADTMKFLSLGLLIELLIGDIYLSSFI